MPNIVRREGALVQRTIPGPPLYVLTTMPGGAARTRAIVGLLHGYGDHAARYQHVADHWAGEHGIGTIALDMRGHGRAGGARGFCSRFDEYLDDAAELWRLVADAVQDAGGLERVSPFLVGHSFGGLVAALSVIEAPRAWRGLALSAPYFELALDVPPLKAALGRIVSRLVPRLRLASGLRGDHMSHDPKRQQAYDDDPLGFKTATARWFDETEKAQVRAQDKAGGLTMPLLTVMGSRDPVAGIRGARRFFDAAGSTDKTWLEQDTLRHECFSEYEWPVVAEEVAAWTSRLGVSHLSRSASTVDLDPLGGAIMGRG